MADPVDDLKAKFSRAIAAAFGAEHAGTDPVLRRSTQERFGDYQANVAMALAKEVGSNPRQVAAAIVEHLDVAGVCEPAEVAGPGFINIRLLPEYVGTKLEETAADERLGVAPAGAPETVVVDYSQPNVAKEMHVGHLRSTIIGDAIVRTLEFLGHRVIRQNHIGDWGTNFGMLIEHLTDLGEDEAASELSLGDLEAFYQQAKRKFDGDPDFADRARRRVVALQSGDAATVGLWQLLIDQSTRYFSAVYERLGVRLTADDIAGESLYNPMLADVAAELEDQGLAVIDDGALCIFPPGFTGRDGRPFPLMVRKSDGGFGYDATDLAALRYRVRELRADRIIYVVDARQAQHFALLFAAGAMAGWLDDRRAEFVPFGAVLGEDGRPFKTRAGGTVKLIDLLDEAVERAEAVVAEKNPGLDPATRAEVAVQVGVGAVKYADLSNDRLKDYVFDLDRMLAFEGNTAPYLQYAHARIRSIFRRAADEGVDASDPWAAGGPLMVGDPAERALALQLLSLGAVVHDTANLLQPHRLCTYLSELAGAFTTFYERCPVLKAATPEERRSRLALCDLTARVLRDGLALLGIEAPERM